MINRGVFIGAELRQRFCPDSSGKVFALFRLNDLNHRSGHSNILRWLCGKYAFKSAFNRAITFRRFAMSQEMV
jgi:hypothetical protein